MTAFVFRSIIAVFVLWACLVSPAFVQPMPPPDSRQQLPNDEFTAPGAGIGLRVGKSGWSMIARLVDCQALINSAIRSSDCRRTLELLRALVDTYASLKVRIK